MIKKAVTLVLVTAMIAALIVPTLMTCSAEEIADPINTQAQSVSDSRYDFENIEYNHTPEFPCEADSTVVVYPDPVKPSNKTLLVDSAGTAASANFYFTDISEKFEVSVDVYAPKLCNWQVGIFLDL